MPDCNLLPNLFLLQPSTARIFPSALLAYFQKECFYFLNFQSLLFQLPETERLFHFNARSIIKETDDREYKNDGRCCQSEIPTT